MLVSSGEFVWGGGDALPTSKPIKYFAGVDS
jgi:hypothetical protein